MNEPTPAPSPATTPLGRIAPGLIILPLLAGLGVLGHRTGWRLTPPASAEAEDDWCAEHGVPESRCLACNPALSGADPADWCREHGVPESVCTTCHPELLQGQNSADWCRGHGVPESSCPKCHPELARVDPAAAVTTPERSVVWVPGQATPNDPSCQLHRARVQFASPEAVTKAGICLERAERRPLRGEVEAFAEVEFDPARVARLSSPLDGALVWVGVELGSRVKAGQPLALVDASALGQAKADLLTALAEVELREQARARVEAAAGAGLRTTAELQEASAALRLARVRQFNAAQALQNLGLACPPLEELRGLDEAAQVARLRGLGLEGIAAASSASANLLPLRAPLDGVVVARDASAGEWLQAGRAAFTVADPARLHVVAHVPQELAGPLRVGQRLRFTPDDQQRAASGRIEWLGSALDERSRTVPVRAVVENGEGWLRAHTFGRARVELGPARDLIAVPDAAVHWEGCCHLVFVQETAGVFIPRKVVPGLTSCGVTALRAGVAAGEVVATEGSQVLLADLLKSRLGAGCCGDE